ncbi:MAG: DUF3826 domain-containing protein [Dysgonamonadaceae bacterium]|jgi:hypothetical protein|nr:DUF3826 domain-containing protein [Dysgonamonadaceae bacterium]
MKIYLFLILFLFSALAGANAQQQDEAAYLKTLTDRSQKIVNTLDIKDSNVYQRVTDMLVNQYKSLGLIHDGLAADIKKTKDEAAISTLKLQADQKLYNLHCEFIGKLLSELSPEQVVQVKDGMTYGVVKVTYDSYCEMIPSLKPEEKRQMMAWLIEGREHAMDAPSSNKKHEWFGKYKGRFNNYLSQKGYDIQKERKAWEERLKTKTQNGGKTKADLDIEKKATEWLAALKLNDEAKESRLQAVIATHLKAVRDWHNEHPYTLIPEGLNPRTGDVLNKVDRQLILDSTLPGSVHEALMSGLRKDLNEEQVEAILDKYTIGKLDFTMKAYREIVSNLTKEEDAAILDNLKKARELSVDYKNMDEISAIFKIYKTKNELFLYQNGKNWKAIYKDYVDASKKK